MTRGSNVGVAQAKLVWQRPHQLRPQPHDILHPYLGVSGPWIRTGYRHVQMYHNVVFRECSISSGKWAMKVYAIINMYNFSAAVFSDHEVTWRTEKWSCKAICMALTQLSNTVWFCVVIVWGRWGRMELWGKMENRNFSLMSAASLNSLRQFWVYPNADL